MLEFGGARLEIERGDCLIQTHAGTGADERDHVVASSEDPGYRRLRRRRAPGPGGRPQALGHFEIGAEVPALEPWAETTVFVGRRERLQMSAKQPSSEHAVGRYGNTKLAAGAKHLALQGFNWLSNRIFAKYEDILDRCSFNWNKLVERPWLIMSIGTRRWAQASDF